MKLFLFFLHKRVQGTFQKENGYKFLLVVMVLIPLALFAGTSFARVLDMAIQGNYVDPKWLLLLFNSILALGFIMLDIFPFYRKSLDLFPIYYPIKKHIKPLLKLFIYSIRYYTLFVIVVYIYLYIVSSYMEFSTLCYSIVYIFSGYVINRIIKNLFENEVPWRGLIFGIVIGTIYIYVMHVYFMTVHFLLEGLYLLICFVILYTCFSYSEVNKTREEGSRWIALSSINKYIKLLFNPHISKSYPYTIFFKIFYLGLAGFFLNSGDEQPMAAMWMFASPLIVIIFAGVNFFGLNRNLLLTHTIRDWQFNHMVKTYILSMGVLILIDSIIFWCFLLFTGLFQWDNILFYYSCAIILLTVSSWFAIHKPVLSNNNMIMDLNMFKNRESTSNFIGIATVIFLYFIIESFKGTYYQGMVMILLFISLSPVVYFCHPSHKKSFNHVNKQVKDI
ncbi:MAG: hypothetical protein WD266_13455 [Balneolales bacterium]